MFAEKFKMEAVLRAGAERVEFRSQLRRFFTRNEGGVAMKSDLAISEESKRVVSAFYAAVNIGDMETFNSLVDEDTVVHEASCLPYGGTYHGAAGALDCLGKVAQYLDFTTIKVNFIAAEGEYAVVSLCLKTKSGKDMHIVEQLHVHNSKIKDVRVFLFDPTLITAK